MTVQRSETLPIAAVERTVMAATVLEVAHRLDILTELAGATGHTAKQVADRRRLDERATQVLLDALVEIGIVERNESGYRAHAELPGLLATMRTGTETLGRRVRTGEPALSGDRPDEAGVLYEELVGLLGTFFAQVAGEIAERLAAPRLRILDVGAGAAPWSRAIAKREPTCTVDALDLPPVVPITRQAVTDAGLDDRFHYIEADILADDLVADRYDLVLAANLCHLFAPKTTEHVIGKLVTAARPGGTVAIIDAVPDHDAPERRRYVALYAAGLLTRTASGRVHTSDEYARWLRGAGARDVTRHDCTHFPATMIRAQAP